MNHPESRAERTALPAVLVTLLVVRLAASVAPGVWTGVTGATDIGRPRCQTGRVGPGPGHRPGIQKVRPRKV